MRDYFLEVRCGCGARRVIALSRMARDHRFATATLAHVALRVTCHGCFTGPTDVHLTATAHGLVSATHGPDAVWAIALVERDCGEAFHKRPGRGHGP